MKVKYCILLVSRSGQDHERREINPYSGTNTRVFLELLLITIVVSLARVLSEFSICRRIFRRSSAPQRPSVYIALDSSSFHLSSQQKTGRMAELVIA